ncbi:PREDICTED: uncharacterized protein LOC109464048 [Branchiostoma belcheri]|uniref:Uncharacterized protein LOC109464048 n=1 Tax=Branchiostoma belcheri TaxID=7741 RepID=A0A6P4YHQ7_BRABE|nr:PREDICTED: uncharacterized protein LOC109464048 [Branchiostoma belcheri]
MATAAAEKPAVLLVHDEYAKNSSINNKVLDVIKENEPGIPVVCTVLKATEEEKQEALNVGVRLLSPSLDQDDNRAPSLDWLTFDHHSRYPHLPSKIRSIVGHAGITSRAAVRIKQERYQDAKLILVTSDIPEDTEYYKGEEKAMGIGKKEDSILEDAQEADVVFSLGDKIFDHFENQFRAIPANKRPKHVKFAPRSSKIFQDSVAEYKDTKTMVVLSIGRVKGVEKLSTESLSIVADKMNIKWRVIVNKDDFEATNAILEQYKSANLQITLIPYGTQKDICKEMMKAHLVLMPSRAEPFGLVGLEAIAAGVPVLVSSKSGLADFIHEHVDELHHSIVDMDGSDIHATVKVLAQGIERILKHNKTEFKTAARGKQQLLSSKYWEESHCQFIQACTDAGHDSQPATVKKRKHSAASIEEAGEDTKALKPEAIKKLEKVNGVNVNGVKKGCLVFFLQCTDLNGLGKVWFMNKTGALDRLLHSCLFREITEQLVSTKSISVKATIHVEDFRKALIYLLATAAPKGLVRITSMDNMMTLTPSVRHVDHASVLLRGLDLAAVTREDHSDKTRPADVSTLNFTVRQVQMALDLRTRREPDLNHRLLHKERMMRVSLEIQKSLLEDKNQQLNDTNRARETKIEELTKENTKLSRQLYMGTPKLQEEVRRLREKGEESQELLLQKTLEIEQLQETNKDMAIRIDELLSAMHKVKQEKEKPRPGPRLFVAEEKTDASDEESKGDQAAAGKDEETRKWEVSGYIGIMPGTPGAGASTFVNSIRGLRPDDPEAAEVSPQQVTKRIDLYPHPVHTNLIIVDFPAPECTYGLMNVEVEEQMDKCNVFLVFISHRIQTDVVQMAQKARAMGKKVLFVCSKFDVDIRHKQWDDPEYFREGQEEGEKHLLQELLQYLVRILKEMQYGHVDTADVFIISGLLDHIMQGRWDAPALERAILKHLYVKEQRSLPPELNNC